MGVFRRGNPVKPYDFEQEEVVESVVAENTPAPDGPRLSPAPPLVSSELRPPVIGQKPSAFYDAPWWDVKRPLHGLAAEGYGGDIHCDAGTFGTVACVAATLRGIKHQVPDRASGRSGQNEDWFSVVCAESSGGTKYVVGVLCDGLSSAKFSWYAARRTSTLLARDIAKSIGALTDVNVSALQLAVDASLDRQSRTIMSWNADEYGSPQIEPSKTDISEFSCTVSCVVLSAEPSTSGGACTLICGSIGDSPIFSLVEDSWIKLTVTEKEDAVLDMRTAAFPRDVRIDLRQVPLSGATPVLMCSDGLGNFLVRDGATLALGGFLSEKWSRPTGVLTFVNHLSFDLPSADDDRTAVMFWQVVSG